MRLSGILVFCFVPGLVSAQSLSDAPQLEPGLSFRTAPAMRAVGLSVDTRSRASVVRFYKEVYQRQSAVPNDWSGSVSGCKAGTTGSAFQEATIGRVNYFRAMAGLPGDVQLLPDSFAEKNRYASLMFEANRSLSHNPPSSWKCFNQKGKEGASHSNIALGASGPGAIDLYIADPGEGNYFVGHRRWVLFPAQQMMAPGSSKGANALWVFGDMKSERPPTPNGVAWPPQGFVPYAFGLSSGYRWSFSYPGADFSRASVQITHEGRNLPVRLERIQNGYGENTMAWTVSGLPSGAPERDLATAVKVSGVRIGGAERAFEYNVTFIDPERAVAEEAPEDTEDPIPEPPEDFQSGR